MSEILSDNALFRYFYDRTAFVTIHGLTVNSNLPSKGADHE